MDSYKSFEPYLKKKLIPILEENRDDLLGFCKKGLPIEEYWTLATNAVRDFVEVEFPNLSMSDCDDILENCEKVADNSWFSDDYSGERLTARTAKHTLSKYATIFLIEMSYPILRECEQKLLQRLIHSEGIVRKTDAELRQITEERFSLTGIEDDALEAVQAMIDVENMDEKAKNFSIDKELHHIQLVLKTKIDYSNFS